MRFGSLRYQRRLVRGAQQLGPGAENLPVFIMALASKLLTAGCTATTAAGTNTLKTTALVNAVADAVLHEIASKAAVTPGQQSVAEAFKADMLTNVATIRIAVYGS